ncbi:HSF-type DNA-binding-domain-containing protein [Sporodiniella umbellata]|nr:HSF-type DNA-binding-domain-containing protein [Sporodiniella umbellata]
MDSRSSSTSSNSSSENRHYKRIKLDTIQIETNDHAPESPNSSAVKTQAAFVNKLYKMLEDAQTADYISWSSQGDLFSVPNPTSFSKCVLPQYFKHNNWQSFVRQLNMYGFHKVNDLIHSNLNNENQTWEFKHPHFKRGAINDLQNIKRKNTKTQLQQLQQVRQKDIQQEATQTKLSEAMETNYISKIESHLQGVTKSCELLYNEIVHLRMVVSKQQVAMQDLVDVISSPRLNNNCDCNSIKALSRANKQDLQDAESLRLQVSKLKESSNENGRMDTKRNLRKFTAERKSSYSSTNPFYSILDKGERPPSFMMSLGKESHMLNPIRDTGEEKKSA